MAAFLKMRQANPDIKFFTSPRPLHAAQPKVVSRPYLILDEATLSSFELPFGFPRSSITAPLGSSHKSANQTEEAE